ncbi:MAG: YceI family protein [Flavobacteriales bacterium]|nr:YceI family protein [Flavobacteriales bacterium]MCB9449623.1 YceI family protein [Flavobacteriales bacterium]
MKHIPYYSLFLFAGTLLLSACGGSETEAPAEETPAAEAPAPAPTCKYSYDNSTTKAYWTAYKHTDKVEVKGTFDSLEVVQAAITDQPQDLLNGATFSIFTGSVNSSDATRDQKIVNFFFGKMTGGEVLTGSLSDVNGSADSGTVSVSLMMNGVENKLEGHYAIEGEELSLRADFDFNNWNAQASLDALQKACAEKHTGKDGVTKFWPEGKILIRTTIKKECDTAS